MPYDDATKDAAADKIREARNPSLLEYLINPRDKGENEQTYQDALGLLRVNAVNESNAKIGDTILLASGVGEIAAAVKAAPVFLKGFFSITGKTLTEKSGLIVNSKAPRNATDLAGGVLENGVQVSGRFKLEGGPKDGIIYRADNRGNVTSYAVYDSDGKILKRVDVTGAAHRGVETPHVIEYGRSEYKNKEGKIVTRVNSPNSKNPPRAAKDEEIP